MIDSPIQKMGNWALHLMLDCNVRVLTKSFGCENAKEILTLHNKIPFQHWTEFELLADADDRRHFYLKWELSHVAMARDNLIGVCFGFADRDSHPGVEFLYLHRLVVAEHFRRLGIGRSLVQYTCRAFIDATGQANSDVIVQTPVESFEGGPEWPVEFYRKLGFQIVGNKKYGDRVDHVMCAVVGRLG